MIRTIEAVVDMQGKVELLDPVRLPAPRRAIQVHLSASYAIGKTAHVRSHMPLEEAIVGTYGEMTSPNGTHRSPSKR